MSVVPYLQYVKYQVLQNFFPGPIINPRSQTGLSEQSPAGPQHELVANKDSEDADGTCYRRVNHNDDSLDNDSEDLDNKAFNPKNNSSPNTESINNMKRSSTRKPSETSVVTQINIL